MARLPGCTRSRGGRRIASSGGRLPRSRRDLARYRSTPTGFVAEVAGGVLEVGREVGAEQVRAELVPVGVEDRQVKLHVHDRLAVALAELGDRDPGGDELLESASRFGDRPPIGAVDRRAAASRVVEEARVVRADGVVADGRIDLVVEAGGGDVHGREAAGGGCGG